MALSIGIDSNVEKWKTCLIENGSALELHTFEGAEATFSYVEQICALYPEPTIGLSTQLNISFGPLNVLSEPQLLQLVLEENLRNDNIKREFTKLANALNLSSYSIPAVRNLLSIPHYRKINRGDMGGPQTLCSLVTLLYRMLQQEAAWSEMNFLYLELDTNAKSILVVKDGQIVDGMHVTTTLYNAPNRDTFLEQDEEIIEQAFWEGLTQDLAGLLAIHHLEDIVLLDRTSPSDMKRGSQSIIDRLSDNYQFYLYPRHEADPEAFEVALGAALVAEGLYHSGLTAEIVSHLQIQL